MATTLVPNTRISLNYSQEGHQHVFRAYAISQGGIPVAGGNLLDRDGNPVAWQDAAEGLCDVFGPRVDAFGSLGPAILEWRQTADVWVPIDAYNTPDSPASSVERAFQLTLVLRDTAFKKVVVIILDSGGFARNKHYSTPGSLPTAEANFCSAWLDSTNPTMYPYHWQVSRGGNYLAEVPMVGVTTTYNDAARRYWGLV